MKIGLFLTNQQRLDVDMVAALDEQIAMARLARDRGWDSLFSGQHYLNEGDNQQLQLVPFLARLIPEAGDMRVGLGVLLLNLHNPVYVAETVATLDVISGGKLIFGVGLGYREVEFAMAGIERGERGALLEECARVLRAAFRALLQHNDRKLIIKLLETDSGRQPRGTRTHDDHIEFHAFAFRQFEFVAHSSAPPQ